MAMIRCKECGRPISNKAKNCPNCGAPVTRGSGCGTLIITFLIILFSMSYITTVLSTHDTKQDNKVSYEKVSKISGSTKITPKEVVFYADDLLGKNVSELKEKLGEPDEEFIPTKKMLRHDPKTTWSIAWYKNGIGLSSDYGKDKKIKYIFIHNDGKKYTKEDLMQMTHLSTGDENYFIIPQKTAFGEPYLTGLHVCGQGADQVTSECITKEQREINNINNVDNAVNGFIKNGLVKKITPELNKVYVNGYHWAMADIEQKEYIGKALALYCGYQKGTKLFWVDIYDWQSGKKVAKYSDSWGLKVY